MYIFYTQLSFRKTCLVFPENYVSMLRSRLIWLGSSHYWIEWRMRRFIGLIHTHTHTLIRIHLTEWIENKSTTSPPTIYEQRRWVTKRLRSSRSQESHMNIAFIFSFSFLFFSFFSWFLSFFSFLVFFSPYIFLSSFFSLLSSVLEAIHHW